MSAEQASPDETMPQFPELEWYTSHDGTWGQWKETRFMKGMALTKTQFDGIWAAVGDMVRQCPLLNASWNVVGRGKSAKTPEEENIISEVNNLYAQVQSFLSGGNNTLHFDVSQVPNQLWAERAIQKLVIRLKGKLQASIPASPTKSQHDDQGSRNEDVAQQNPETPTPRTQKRNRRAADESHDSDDTNGSKRPRSAKARASLPHRTRAPRDSRAIVSLPPPAFAFTIPPPIHASPHGQVPTRMMAIRVGRIVDGQVARDTIGTTVQGFLSDQEKSNLDYLPDDLSFEKFISFLQERFRYDQNVEELGWSLGNTIVWEPCEEPYNWKAACAVQQASGSAYFQFYLRRPRSNSSASQTKESVDESLAGTVPAESTAIIEPITVSTDNADMMAVDESPADSLPTETTATINPTAVSSNADIMAVDESPAGADATETPEIINPITILDDADMTAINKSPAKNASVNTTAARDPEAGTEVEISNPELNIVEHEEDPTDKVEAAFLEVVESSVLAQMGPNNEHWKADCIFFKIDPALSTSKSQYQLPMLLVALWGYQLHAIRWMMRQARTTAHGGYITDVAGLGKTLEVIGWILVEHIFAYMWEEVEVSWETGNGLHLPRDYFDPAARCPSESRWPLQCPCLQTGFVKNAQAHHGVNVIIASKSLLQNWIDEWNKFIGTSPYEDQLPSMKLFTQHGETKRGSRKIPQDLTNSKLNQIRNGKDRGALLGSTAYTFLTTSQSFGSHLYDSVLYGQQKHYQRNKHVSTTIVRRVDVARAIRDEFHEEKSPSSNAVTLFKKMPMAHKFFLSGTPVVNGPSDLVGYLSVLETDKWQRKNNRFHNCQSQKVASLGIQYSNFIKTDPKSRDDDAVAALIAEYVSILEKIMLRRTDSTMWVDGTPLQSLPPQSTTMHKVQPPTQEYLDLSRGLNERTRKHMQARYEAALAAWHIKGGRAPTLSVEAYIRGSRLLRMAADFPGLLKLAAQNPAMAFNVQEIERNNWYKEPALSVYYENLDMLITSSPKIKELENVLRAHDDEALEGAELPKKSLVFSDFPVIAFILSLYFQFKSDRNAIYIHAQLTTNDRNQLIRGFCGKGEPDSPEGLWVKGNQSTIMLSTPRLSGTGLTLTRATQVVEFEPFMLGKDEIQVPGRICRIGQKLATRVDLLYAPWSQQEVETKDKNRMKESLQSLTQEATKRIEKGNEPEQAIEQSQQWYA